MEKDLNNILSYFGLNFKIENNEMHIFDASGIEYDIYYRTDPMNPKKTNNVDTLFQLNSCNIVAVPMGKSIQETDLFYSISMLNPEGEITGIIAIKHQKSNQDINNISTTEIRFEKDNYVGSKHGYIKEFINDICKTTYIMDEQRDYISYNCRNIDEEGKMSEYFTIAFDNNSTLITSHINEVHDKETVLSSFEQSQLFQKMLKDYFPKLNEQCYRLKSGDMNYTISNHIYSSGRTN